MDIYPAISALEEKLREAGTVCNPQTKKYITCEFVKVYTDTAR